MSTVDVFKPRGAGGERHAVRWPLHAAFAVTLVGFCALYAETFASLISTWARTGRYQYAFLIFPVCAVLIWLRRDILRQLAATPKPAGLAAAFLLCVLWLAGAAAHINLVTQFAVVAMIPCLVFTFYGTAITRTLMFPLAYLIFAVPFGNFLVGPLQDITAHLSVAALQLTSIPVFLNGRFIMTPATTWHVAEACSGISFFFATTAFGVLYANLFYRSWRRRLIFVAFALIVPIVANGLRVFFTILIGENFGIEYATGTDHLIFGWQFFGTVIVVLFLAGWPWHEPEVPLRTPRGKVSGTGRATRPPQVLVLLVGSVALLAVAPIWIHATEAAPVSDNGPAEVLTLPEALGGLPRTGTLAIQSGPGTVFRNADRYARARYGAGRSQVLVNIAVYEGASGDSNELVDYGNRLFDSSQWVVVDELRSTTVSAPAGLAEVHLANRSGDARWIVWYAYRLGSHVATAKIMVKFWQAWNRLLGQPADARVVILASPVAEGDSAAAARRLARVAKDLVPWLRRHSGRGKG